MQHQLVAATAGLALTAVLATACGQGPAGTGSSPPATLAQQLDRFVQCMDGHGQPGLYLTQAPASPNPGRTLVVFHGFAINGASTGSPQFQPAMQACQHLLPHGTPPTAAELRQQYLRSLKAARCMRSHGYPAWPDPIEQDGHNMIPVPPAGVRHQFPAVPGHGPGLRTADTARRPMMSGS